MLEVRYGRSANGDTVREYLAELNEKARTDPEAKAQLKQILTYMEVLQKTIAPEEQEQPEKQVRLESHQRLRNQQRLENQPRLGNPSRLGHAI